jgi:hypothetical protein
MIAGLCIAQFFFGGYLFDSIPVRAFGHTRGNLIVAIGLVTLLSVGLGVYLLLCNFLQKSDDG